jgi:hypothetical protein
VDGADPGAIAEEPGAADGEAATEEPVLPGDAAESVSPSAATEGGGAAKRRRREAITAPKTVELAAIHVAQPRLPSHTLSSTVAAAGQATTPRP